MHWLLASSCMPLGVHGAVACGTSQPPSCAELRVLSTYFETISRSAASMRWSMSAAALLMHCSEAVGMAVSRHGLRLTVLDTPAEIEQAQHASAWSPYACRCHGCGHRTADAAGAQQQRLLRQRDGLAEQLLTVGKPRRLDVPGVHHVMKCMHGSSSTLARSGRVVLLPEHVRKLFRPSSQWRDKNANRCWTELAKPSRVSPSTGKQTTAEEQQ